MHALVVFESMYGNTKEVATAVAAGLSKHMPVEVAEVGTAPTVIGDDVSLLVVGAPTHAHGMSQPGSRRSAADRADATNGIVSTGIGVREWLGNLGDAPVHVAVATFDTRLRGPGLIWGSAAKAAELQLRDSGATVVVPAQSFFVNGPRGSAYHAVSDTELERARAWGRGSRQRWSTDSGRRWRRPRASLRSSLGLEHRGDPCPRRPLGRQVGADRGDRQAGQGQPDDRRRHEHGQGALRDARSCRDLAHVGEDGSLEHEPSGTPSRPARRRRERPTR